jgi:hypothetical protein
MQMQWLQKKFSEKRLVVQSFCFGLLISPPLALSAKKRRKLRGLLQERYESKYMSKAKGI